MKEGEKKVKLTKESLASGLALTTAIAWVVCSGFVTILPNLSLIITRWWMHGMPLPGSFNLNIANFLLGGITLVVSAWLFGYLLGWSLEYFSKKNYD